MKASRNVRSCAILGSVILALAVAPAAMADSTAIADSSATRVFTLTPSTHGNPEGIASDENAGGEPVCIKDTRNFGGLYSFVEWNPTARVRLEGWRWR